MPKKRTRPLKPHEVEQLELIPRGVTGLKRDQTHVYDEWLAPLKGSRAIKVYREMADNDAVIGAGLWMFESQIRQTAFEIKLADENNEAARYAEYIEGCLDDMSHTWNEFISNVMTMCWAGYALHEIIYKIRRGYDAPFPEFRSKNDDGLIGWRKLEGRAQETIAEWRFQQDGGVECAIQRADPDYKTREIPLRDALLFRVRSPKNNPEGRSMLRNAYRSWFYLKRLQEFEVIGVERDMAGLLTFRLPVAFFNAGATAAQQATIANYRQIGERVRRGQYECLIFPTSEDSKGKTGFEASLMQSGGRRPMDTDGIIKRLESRIAISFLGEQMLLGMQGQAGSGASWSLASSKTHLMALSLKAIMESIADVINRFGIPRLMRRNGWPEAASPYIEFSDIETDESGEFASSVASLIAAGGLNVGPALEEYLRKRLGIPPEEEISWRSGATQDALGALGEKPPVQQDIEAQQAIRETIPIKQDTLPIT